VQFSVSIGAALLALGCSAQPAPSARAEPRPVATLDVPSAEPPAPVVDASAPDAAPTGARRLLRFSAGGGWEAASAWAELERVLPAIDRCAFAHSERQSEVELRVHQAAELSRSVQAPDGLRQCVEKALEPFTAPPVVSPGGRPTLLARFGYFASAADMPPLPEPGADEIIVVAPDGSCLGRERGVGRRAR
jgi:hypothetical protein